MTSRYDPMIDLTAKYMSGQEEGKENIEVLILQESATPRKFMLPKVEEFKREWEKAKLGQIITIRLSQNFVARNNLLSDMKFGTKGRPSPGTLNG